MTKTKMTHQEWCETILQSYVAKNNPTSGEVEHIKDFLDKNPKFKVSTRVSYLSVKEQSEKWTEKLNEKNRHLKESGYVEVKHLFPDGMQLVHLQDQIDKNWEGKHMGHCVASYTNHEGIYSLRDQYNFPHCTIEVGKLYDRSPTVKQIKGKGNGVVATKYHSHVVTALKAINVPLTGSDLENIGYHRVDKAELEALKEHFSGIILLHLKPESNYLCLNSKVKLIKTFTAFNRNLYGLFRHTTFDCLEAFKQLFLLRLEDYTHYDSSDVEGLSLRGKTAYVKFIFEHTKDLPRLLAQTSLYLPSAVKSGNVETFKFILAQHEGKIKKDKYYATLSLVEDSNLKKCLQEAILKGYPEIVLSILETRKVFILNEQLPELLRLAVREEHGELLNLAMSYSEKFQLKEYISSINILISRKKIELAKIIVSRLNHPRNQVTDALYLLWSQNNKTELLEFILSEFGFEAADYRSTLLHMSMHRTGQVPAALFILSKMGANLKMEGGVLFTEAIKFDNHPVATALLMEGVLENVNVKSLPLESTKKYARLLAGSETFKEEAKVFLAKLKESNHEDVVFLMEALMRGESVLEVPPSLTDRLFQPKGGLIRRGRPATRRKVAKK